MEKSWTCCALASRATSARWRPARRGRPRSTLSWRPGWPAGSPLRTEAGLLPSPARQSTAGAAPPLFACTHPLAAAVLVCAPPLSGAHPLSLNLRRFLVCHSALGRRCLSLVHLSADLPVYLLASAAAANLAPSCLAFIGRVARPCPWSPAPSLPPARAFPPAHSLHTDPQFWARLRRPLPALLSSLTHVFQALASVALPQPSGSGGFHDCFSKPPF